ncbi:hypothetical protein BSNK01_03590 [Bacillaceae bacterium]
MIRRESAKLSFLLPASFWLTLLALAAVAWHFVSAPVAAAERQIRVALFIDTGKYARQTVPTVTLSSPSGMSVYVADETGMKLFRETAGGAPHRFSYDGYGVLVAETANPQNAQQAAQRLSKANIRSDITAVKGSGGFVYRVVAGYKKDLAGAKALQQQIAQYAGIEGRIIGPHRLQAGGFATEREARKTVETIAAAGFPAWLGAKRTADGLQYVALAGDEPSAEALDPLAERLEASLAGLKVQPSGGDVFVLKEDALLSGGSVDTTPHLYVPAGKKAVVVPKEGRGIPLVSVAEKQNRSYRGKMEVREYNGNLALINELSVEEYLYGVVGSEMASGWPLEALKAQAVLARTKAYAAGLKYDIAHVSDTVLEQAYYGYEREAEDIRQAVEQTRGKVIKYEGKLVESLYYSNAGGMTADGSEVWGNVLPYLAPVPSDDAAPEKRADLWYKVVLADGDVGFVHSASVQVLPEKNVLGYAYGVVTGENVNLRNGPGTQQQKSLRALQQGMRVVILDRVPENNAYSWSRGPYTGEEIAAMIRAYGANGTAAPLAPASVQRLEVSRTGPSGRVTEMKVNGQILPVKYPDAYRSIFREDGAGLRSGKFTVEEMGRLAVLAAQGNAVETTSAGGLHAVAAGNGATNRLNGYADYFFVFDGQKVREVSKRPMFRFHGKGYGHGYGLSQYGAKAMAESGYGYVEILTHYYREVTVEPY